MKSISQAAALAALAMRSFAAVAASAIDSIKALGSAVRDDYQPARPGGHRSRSGWTNASYQRAARKLRNKAKHRRACRG